MYSPKADAHHTVSNLGLRAPPQRSYVEALSPDHVLSWSISYRKCYRSLGSVHKGLLDQDPENSHSHVLFLEPESGIYLGITMSRPVTPASPRVLRPRSQEPGVPMYGCGKNWLNDPGCRSNNHFLEHIQMLLTKAPEVTTNTIQHYKMLLRVIFDNTAVIPQTSVSSDGVPKTSLTSNYLCLQCPSTTTENGRKKHGLAKAHQFCL